jgi:DNA-binding helix-hairpin-helix protein with protein kinase domain
MVRTRRERTVLVFDKAGQAQVLGDEIARGGEGSVHLLASKHAVVVKLYHPELLARRSTQLREKVNAMIGLRQHFASSSLAWPALSVHDEHGSWIGYAMRRAGGVPLAKLAHPMLCQKHVPGLDRITVTRLLVTIVRTLGSLHGAGVILGDINLNNFLYDPATGAVTLIDCDSYQVTAEGRLFPCVVGAADMIPPEHHGKTLADVQRTAESDLFSLAILIFRCLMLGRHPYDFVGGGTVVENLCGGRFPYGMGGSAPGRNGAIPAGPWYLIWSHLSFEIKSLLIRTLLNGAADPTVRARPSEWLIAFDKYATGLAKGYHDVALRPSLQKSSERKGHGPSRSAATRAAI